MPEYRFFLTRTFPYIEKIVDSVLRQEYTGQRKPLFRHILRSVSTNPLSEHFLTMVRFSMIKPSLKHSKNV